MRRRVISYGYIVADHFQRAAAYVDPILKGKLDGEIKRAGLTVQGGGLRRS